MLRGGVRALLWHVRTGKFLFQQEKKVKSSFQFVLAVGAAMVAGMGSALAAPVLNVPEPGSMALVGVAIGALVYVTRKGKK